MRTLTHTLTHWHSSYAVNSSLYWLTDRIAQTSSKSSWYKVTLRKWRSSRCTLMAMREREYAGGNVSVNVNANSNMPVIIISASTVARRPFPGSSWHPLSFASVAHRWPRGSLISRNCDDPRSRWRTLNSQQLGILVIFHLENLIWNWQADVRATNLKTRSRLTVEFLTLDTEKYKSPKFV